MGSVVVSVLGEQPLGAVVSTLNKGRLTAKAFATHSIASTLKAYVAFSYKYAYVNQAPLPQPVMAPSRLASSVLQSVRQCLYEARQPQQALHYLSQSGLRQALAKHNSPTLWRNYHDLVAYSHMALNQWPQAAQAFSKGYNPYMAGYAYWLANEFDKCRPLWLPLVQAKRNHWCQVLFSLASGQTSIPPSFLQVRNHLECDMGYLLQAKNELLLQRLLSRVPWLAQTNPEAYKYAGRAMMFGHRWSEARPLLLKAQALFPQDAEIYFHLGQLEAHCQNTAYAKLALQQCLFMNADYNPARWLLASLNEALPNVTVR